LLTGEKFNRVPVYWSPGFPSSEDDEEEDEELEELEDEPLLLELE
jgi:hypothetical protein